MGKEAEGAIIRTHLAAGPITYDGRQMDSQWAYRTFGVPGDAIVAFIGPCDVPAENILDLADAHSIIRGPLMLHFIVEHFDRDLEKGVLRQRLLAGMVKEELESRARVRLRRDGDDLYDGDAKLSISIAALTPVSCKIHFAINIKEAGDVGVKTRGIDAYRIEPRDFARAVLERYRRETVSIYEARCKARAAR